MDFCVIFDMDGVVIDSNALHKKSWITFLKNYNIELNEEEWEKNMFGRTGKETLNQLFNYSLTNDLVNSYCEEIHVLYRKLAKGKIQPLKGLPEFLKALKEHNIKTALATSAPTGNVTFVFNETNLGKYFDAVVDEEQVKHSKPDPEVFLRAASKLNYKPENCVVFEDSISGIKAAKAAGMKVIGVTTTHPASVIDNTDYTIDDFSGLSVNKLTDIFGNNK